MKTQWYQYEPEQKFLSITKEDVSMRSFAETKNLHVVNELVIRYDPVTYRKKKMDVDREYWVKIKTKNIDATPYNRSVLKAYARGKIKDVSVYLHDAILVKGVSLEFITDRKLI